MLKETVRVLKPGGTVFAIVVPRKLFSLHRPLHRWLGPQVFRTRSAPATTPAGWPNSTASSSPPRAVASTPRSSTTCRPDPAASSSGCSARQRHLALRSARLLLRLRRAHAGLDDVPDQVALSASPQCPTTRLSLCHSYHLSEAPFFDPSVRLPGKWVNRKARLRRSRFQPI